MSDLTSNATTAVGTTHPQGCNSWERGGASEALQSSAPPRPWAGSEAYLTPPQAWKKDRLGGGGISGFLAEVLNREDKEPPHSPCRLDTKDSPDSLLGPVPFQKQQDPTPDHRAGCPREWA